MLMRPKRQRMDDGEGIVRGGNLYAEILKTPRVHAHRKGGVQASLHIKDGTVDGLPFVKAEVQMDERAVVVTIQSEA